MEIKIIESLLELMEDMDVNSRHFALELGFNPNVVCNWLNGRNKPTLENVSVICKKCGVNADWLLFGIGPKRREVIEKDC